MVQADTIMLDHSTGQLTYALYSETKEQLHDDCSKIEVETVRWASFESDSQYTILDFEFPVDLEVEERDDRVVAVVRDSK